MKHVQSLREAHLDTASFVTIGVFDGLHTGHQSLIRRLVAKAHAEDKLAVVLTFFPHPDKVLREVEDRYYLMSPNQRAKLLLDMGVDCVVTHPFDDAIRQMRANEFVDQLVTDWSSNSPIWVNQNYPIKPYKAE